MHLASATPRKSLITVASKGSRRYARAGLYRDHSGGKRAGGGLAGALVITLVIVGLIYAVALGREATPTSEIGVNGFAQHRIARIVIPTDDGHCRERAFYNDDGLIGPDRVVVCDWDRRGWGLAKQGSN